MLTLRPPVRIRCGRDIRTLPDTLGERIQANYQMMQMQMTPEDFLHLVTVPPELYGEEKSRTQINIRHLTENNQMHFTMLTQLLNRIMLYETSQFTYADRVYVDNVLRKIGVKCPGEFLQKLREVRVLDHSRQQVLTLYHENHEKLSEAVKWLHADKADRKLQQYLQQKKQQTLQYYLQDGIYQRLHTAQLCKMVKQYGSRQECVPVMQREDFWQSQELRRADFIFLGQEKRGMAGGLNVIEQELENPYEYVRELPSEVTQAYLCTEAATAAIWQLAENFSYSLLRSQKIEAGEKGTEPKQFWVTISQNAYQSVEDTFQRFLEYHKRVTYSQRIEKNAAKKAENLYQQEIYHLNQFAEQKDKWNAAQNITRVHLEEETVEITSADPQIKKDRQEYQIQNKGEQKQIMLELFLTQIQHHQLYQKQEFRKERRQNQEIEQMVLELQQQYAHKEEKKKRQTWNAREEKETLRESSKILETELETVFETTLESSTQTGEYTLREYLDEYNQKNLEYQKQWEKLRQEITYDITYAPDAGRIRRQALNSIAAKEEQSWQTEGAKENGTQAIQKAKVQEQGQQDIRSTQRNQFIQNRLSLVDEDTRKFYQELIYKEHKEAISAQQTEHIFKELDKLQQNSRYEQKAVTSRQNLTYKGETNVEEELEKLTQEEVLFKKSTYQHSLQRAEPKPFEMHMLKQTQPDQTSTERIRHRQKSRRMSEKQAKAQKKLQQMSEKLEDILEIDNLHSKKNRNDYIREDRTIQNRVYRQEESAATEEGKELVNQINLIYRQQEAEAEKQWESQRQEEVSTKETTEVIHRVETNKVVTAQFNQWKQETLQSETIKLQQMIEENLHKQVNQITDKVYGKLERRLQNERKRRGY